VCQESGEAGLADFCRRHMVVAVFAAAKISFAVVDVDILSHLLPMTLSNFFKGFRYLLSAAQIITRRKRVLGVKTNTAKVLNFTSAP